MNEFEHEKLINMLPFIIEEAARQKVGCNIPGLPLVNAGSLELMRIMEELNGISPFPTVCMYHIRAGISRETKRLKRERRFK